MDIVNYALSNKIKKYVDESVGNIPDEKITEAVNTYLNENPVTPGATDEQATQIQKNTDDITGLKSDIEQLKQSGGSGSGTGLSTEAIDKLEEVGNYLAYTTADGGSKWTELISILRNSSSGGGSGETEKTLSSISATYTGGDVAVGTALDDLTGITVTALYSDGSTANVTGYTLSGEIAEGENTITVSYCELTTTFTVTGIASVTLIYNWDFTTESLVDTVQGLELSTDNTTIDSDGLHFDSANAVVHNFGFDLKNRTMEVDMGIVEYQTASSARWMFNFSKTETTDDYADGGFRYDVSAGTWYLTAPNGDKVLSALNSADCIANKTIKFSFVDTGNNFYILKAEIDGETYQSANWRTIASDPYIRPFIGYSGRTLYKSCIKAIRVYDIE